MIHLTKRVSAGLSLAALLVVIHAPSAQSAPIVNCEFAEGGGFRNVTVRAIGCDKARPVVLAVLHDVRACWAAERSLGSCSYRRGTWNVRGQWFRDEYGSDQLDLRATASGGRVVRFQTDWDGE